MVYFLGKEISEGVPVCVGIREIYGIGRGIANKVCKKLNVDPWILVGKLDYNLLQEIGREVRQTYVLDIDLRRQTEDAIRSEMENRSYRGLRHRYSLPVNGQRTRSNGRTAKLMLKKSKEKKNEGNIK